MNIWLNEQNYEREHALVGGLYSGVANTQNTVFCLFEPDAEGMRADSFPVESSMHYGTRVGRPYPVCCTHTPENGLGLSREKRASYIKKRRKEDLGEDTPAHIVERILWEQENGGDGPGLAKIMDDLAAMHPVKETAEDSLPGLPLLPDLTQAINMGATDSRAVLVLVRPAATVKGEPASMDTVLRQLLFDEGIVGRMHAVIATPAEWAEAKATGKVAGSDLSAGLMFLRPDYFGQSAEVQTEIPAAASLEVTRSALADSLKVFRQTWRKLDRAQLLKKGMAEGITWREWHPEAKRIIELPVGKWRGEVEKPSDDVED